MTTWCARTGVGAASRWLVRAGRVETGCGWRSASPRLVASVWTTAVVAPEVWLRYHLLRCRVLVRLHMLVRHHAGEGRAQRALV